MCAAVWALCAAVGSTNKGIILLGKSTCGSLLKEAMAANFDLVWVVKKKKKKKKKKKEKERKKKIFSEFLVINLMLS